MKDMASEALAVSEMIKPMLAGRPPEVQGSTLANLLSLFIAGHAPEAREDVLQLHIKCVRELVPASENELFGKDGWPGKHEGS